MSKSSPSKKIEWQRGGQFKQKTACKGLEEGVWHDLGTQTMPGWLSLLSQRDWGAEWLGGRRGQSTVMSHTQELGIGTLLKSKEKPLHSSKHNTHVLELALHEDHASILLVDRWRERVGGQGSSRHSRNDET